MKIKKISAIIISTVLLFLLSACSHIIVLNPKGLVGAQEKDLLISAVGLMAIVVVPVLILTVVFAYKYRASNPKAQYDPNFYHSNKLEAVIWAIPIAIIIVLAIMTWRTTHDLDPYKQLDIPGKPLLIQVVALDWKWLFIYPEQNIATVNFFEFPVNRAIEFKLTADAPMNAFQIPQLGGQIYAMAGMQTQLHLVANETGDYFGRGVNISGRGFSGMQFVARATTAAEFELWVKDIKRSPHTLSAAQYMQLVKPTENEPVSVYSAVQKNLFNNIIMKFMMPGMDDLSIDNASMM